MVTKFLRNRLVFYREAFRQSQEVGAFTHTSKAVADAIAEPIVRGDRPLRVLEVGAGTGALTRSIVRRLGPGDQLDLIEINPEFVHVLQEQFGTRPGGPEVRVDQRDVELLPRDEQYDVIVSSLPLLNFPPEKVRRVFELFLTELLKPGGTLSYYDYWAKELRTFVVGPRERRRMKEVLRITKEFRQRYEVKDRLIPWNLTPALVHYLRRPV
ncbi:MAG: methyltransferase domain-containing protein [Planctomycetes bacterium]|nr:methyltransferase domain-containing protein [Planctomycetota bacterium]